MTSTRVVIAGGGPAAFETALALDRLAAGRVGITLLTPDPDFALRPLSVGEAFGTAAPHRYSAAAIAADRGFTLVRDTVSAVHPSRHRLTTGGGDELAYDVLVLAIGAQPLEAVPGALTFRGTADVPQLRRMMLELLVARAPRVAFVAAPTVAWTLPAYELALLAGSWAGARGTELDAWVVTHEQRPLEIFGEPASARVAAALARSGVRVWCGAEAELVEDGRLWVAMEGGLPVHLAVALARPGGRAVPGISCDEHGFTPVDELGRVPGARDVYAVGDMTTRPLKQGGLATEQAQATASAIAAQAGAPVEPLPYRAALRAELLTGNGVLHLGEPGEAAGKIASRDLGPYLIEHPSFGVAVGGD